MSLVFSWQSGEKGKTHPGEDSTAVAAGRRSSLGWTWLRWKEIRERKR